MMKVLCLTVVPLGCSHLFLQSHSFSALENGCAFPQTYLQAKTLALACHLGFMDNWKVSAGVGISTAAVDLLSVTAGEYPLNF